MATFQLQHQILAFSRTIHMHAKLLLNQKQESGSNLTLIEQDLITKKRATRYK